MIELAFENMNGSENLNIDFSECIRCATDLLS
jgi:hypothetical protein